MDEHVGDGLKVKSEESVEVLETKSIKVKEESETISEDTPGYENITESPTLLTSNDEFEFDNLTVDERDNTGETFISNQIGTVFNPDEMVEDEMLKVEKVKEKDIAGTDPTASEFTRINVNKLAFVTFGHLHACVLRTAVEIYSFPTYFFLDMARYMAQNGKMCFLCFMYFMCFFAAKPKKIWAGFDVFFQET